jgi:hypothetical protein
VGDSFGTRNLAAGLLAFLDIGGRPDRVEGLVEAQPRIDVAWKLVRLGDDRLQRGAHESIAMGLAAGQGAGIAAQEGAGFVATPADVGASSCPSDIS